MSILLNSSKQDHAPDYQNINDYIAIESNNTNHIFCRNIFSFKFQNNILPEQGL